MRFRVTANYTWPKTLLNKMLANLSIVPVAAPLVTPTVELYTSDTLPTPESVEGDFTRANFSGYAAQLAAFAPPVNLTVNIQGKITPAIFTAAVAAPFVPNTIKGYILTDGATAYYGGELFSESVQIAEVGDFLELELCLPLGAYQPAA